MKKLITLTIIIYSLTTSAQQMTSSQWEEEVKTNIRLMPKYGHFPKNENQKKSDKEFIETALKQVKKQAFIFLSEDTVINTLTNFDSSHIQVLKSGAGYTKCIIRNETFKWLTLLQNNYRYWEVRIDGEKVIHQTGFKTFISVPVEKGVHTIEFEFNPTMIKSIMWINLLLLLTSLVVICIPKLAGRKVFK